MHELSIAASIVELAAAQAQGRSIARIGVRIGHLRQVVPSTLLFNFRLVAAGTLAERAELEIESVPALVHCRLCLSRSEQAAFPLLCGRCQSSEVEVIRGTELLLDWLEVETM